jgi:hypothetical protein
MTLPLLLRSQRRLSRCLIDALEESKANAWQATLGLTRQTLLEKNWRLTSFVGISGRQLRLAALKRMLRQDPNLNLRRQADAHDRGYNTSLLAESYHEGWKTGQDRGA